MSKVQKATCPYCQSPGATGGVYGDYFDCGSASERGFLRRTTACKRIESLVDELAEAKEAEQMRLIAMIREDMHDMADRYSRVAGLEPASMAFTMYANKLGKS